MPTKAEPRPDDALQAEMDAVTAQLGLARQFVVVAPVRCGRRQGRRGTGLVSVPPSVLDQSPAGRAALFAHEAWHSKTYWGFYAVALSLVAYLEGVWLIVGGESGWGLLCLALWLLLGPLNWRGELACDRAAVRVAGEAGLRETLLACRSKRPWIRQASLASSWIPGSHPPFHFRMWMVRRFSR